VCIFSDLAGGRRKGEESEGGRRKGEEGAGKGPHPREHREEGHLAQVKISLYMSSQILCFWSPNIMSVAGGAIGPLSNSGIRYVVSVLIFVSIGWSERLNSSFVLNVTLRFLVCKSRDAKSRESQSALGSSLLSASRYQSATSSR